MAETELQTVPGWPPELVARLAAVWINTADQVVAVSATPGGLQSLAQQLQVPEDEARQLVKLANAALSPPARAAMAQPVTTDRGLGALGVLKPTKEEPQEPEQPNDTA